LPTCVCHGERITAAALPDASEEAVRKQLAECERLSAARQESCEAVRTPERRP
jgi:hypothetical protein